MSFPDCQRVIYKKKNPLEAVVCQFRFPAILKIDTNDVLAKFQEKIRADYPNYITAPQVNLPPNLPPEVVNMIMQDVASQANRVNKFASADDVWKLSLTQNFIALTCSKYNRWEDFQAKFFNVLDVLQSECTPAYFTRIGLRYRNVIKKSELGLIGVNWSELIKPRVLGIMASQPEEAVLHSLTQLQMKISDGSGKLQINQGLMNDNNDEICYLIDTDFFYDEKTEAGDAKQRLNKFNTHARNFFRWSIEDKLHNAMEPEPIR